MKLVPKISVFTYKFWKKKCDEKNEKWDIKMVEVYFYGNRRFTVFVIFLTILCVKIIIDIAGGTELNENYAKLKVGCFRIKLAR